MTRLASLLLATALALGPAFSARADEAMPMAASVTMGALTVSAGSARAMLPGAKVGGGYLTIVNAGPESDRLVSVASPTAGRVELHEMTMDNDVMKMRRLDDGLALPAGETVALTPGGYHLMFLDVVKPFAKGETVPLTLTFEKAGSIDYTLPVGAASGGHSMHK